MLPFYLHGVIDHKNVSGTYCYQKMSIVNDGSMSYSSESKVVGSNIAHGLSVEIRKPVETVQNAIMIFK